MSAILPRIEALHGALIAALDGQDVAAIEDAGRRLGDGLDELRGNAGAIDRAALVGVAARVRPLARAAAMRINLLSDHTRRRAEMLAAMRGRPVAATYTR